MSFLLYAIGLAAIFFSHIVVTNLMNQEQIADWALFRSLVGISAVLPLTGLDQVLVRSPQSSARLMRRLALQIPMVGLLVGLILDITDILDHWALGAGLAIGSALSLKLFQYFRSHHRRVLAQLAQQGWKIGALGLLAYLVATDTNADLILCGVVLLFVADAVAGVFVWRNPPKTMMPQTPEPMAALYSIGVRFMVTGLFLALSVYAEQIVVNRLGTTDQAALYFTSATYFLFPMAFVNGYVSFLAGPWVRDNADQAFTVLGKWGLRGSLAIIAYGALLNAIGWIAWQITDPTVGSVNTELQIVFGFICIVRTVYILPSAYVGVLGRPRQHDMLILSQVAALAIVVALFLALRASGFDLIHAVALSSITNWTLRCLAGFAIMNQIHQTRPGAYDA